MICWTVISMTKKNRKRKKLKTNNILKTTNSHSQHKKVRTQLRKRVHKKHKHKQQLKTTRLPFHPPRAAAAVRKALRRAGLDPRGEDELYLVRYENESKDSRRQDASGDYCIVAILGDQKRDFDSLFGYLKNPDDAFALDQLIGEAWFLGPPPIAAPIGAPITAQTSPSQG